MTEIDASETTNPELDINLVISDLEVLLEKCRHDIDAKDRFWNTMNYCSEFNRILTDLQQAFPMEYQDIAPILVDSSSRGEIVRNTVSPTAGTYLFKVDAEADKLLRRLRIKKETTLKANGKTQAISILEMLCNRFDQVARQLRRRYKDRETLKIADEYDVQDLMHALLKISFEDIRPEEWTPSYAGSSNRMDFLLKAEQVVIEVKKTRDALRDKEIGKQLIEDITKYKEHPDCKTLVCFIYDPEGYIGNPTGLERDLAKLSSANMEIRVFIRP